MHVLGGALERYVQRKLSGQKLFQEPFVCVRDSLRSAINICEQWVVDCEHLTGQVFQKSYLCVHFKERLTVIVVNCAELHSQVWKRYTPYPWKGNKHCPQMLNSFVKRLDEVRLRLT